MDLINKILRCVLITIILIALVRSVHTSNILALIVSLISLYLESSLRLIEDEIRGLEEIISKQSDAIEEARDALASIYRGTDINELS